MHDLSNWTEPLGLASLFVEGAVVALAAAVLTERHATPAASAPRTATITA